MRQSEVSGLRWDVRRLPASVRRDDMTEDAPRRMWVDCDCPTVTPDGGWSVTLENGMAVYLQHPPRSTGKSGPPGSPQAVKPRELLNEFLRLRAEASPEVRHMLDQLSDLDACRAASPDVDQALRNLEALDERTRGQS